MVKSTHHKVFPKSMKNKKVLYITYLTDGPSVKRRWIWPIHNVLMYFLKPFFGILGSLYYVRSLVRNQTMPFEAISYCAHPYPQVVKPTEWNDVAPAQCPNRIRVAGRAPSLNGMWSNNSGFYILKCWGSLKTN